MNALAEIILEEVRPLIGERADTVRIDPISDGTDDHVFRVLWWKYPMPRGVLPHVIRIPALLLRAGSYDQMEAGFREACRAPFRLRFRRFSRVAARCG